MSGGNYLFLTVLIYVLISPNNGQPLQETNNNDINEYYKTLARSGALEAHPMMKYVASLKFKSDISYETTYTHNHICAGIIITERAVVTAAHCLFGKGTEIFDPDDLEIVAGFSLGTFEDKYLQTVPVRKTIMYPNYLPMTYTDDLAIVITAEPFDIIEGRLEIALIPDSPVMPNQRCSVLGFVNAQFKNTKLTHILEDEIKVWPANSCYEFLQNNGMDKKGKYCGGDHQSSKSGMKCTDIGSEPMICNDNAYGLLLMNIGCDASTGYTGIYLHLPFYKNWLSSHVEGRTLLTSSQGRRSLEFSKIMAMVSGLIILLQVAL